MDVAGQSVVVVGLARSGVAAARLLARREARVVATDRKPAGELAAQVLSLRELGVRLELGRHDVATFRDASLVVVSPGVPWDLPELQAARGAGVPVIAELELAFRHMKGTLAAVTGTKGKSTTTAALGAMLREAGGDVRVGGNIGEAACGLLEAADERTTFVLEVSSFQLEGIQSFRPRVAVFLNLSADHLDRHPDFPSYAAAKARIFENQTETDWAVVNADDPGVLALARAGRARTLAFGGAPPHDDADADGAFLAEGEARLRRAGATETLFPLDSVRVPGAHLRSDLLAAGAAARLLGAPAEAVARAVAGFAGIEHVLERVAEIEGVAYFNDSKATNVDAARRGLLALPAPLHVIMGGRFKGGDFADLREAVRGRVRTLLLIGEASGRIAQALAGETQAVACASLREAVLRARAAARPGDTVLLAPACASFDMFRDYAERGRAFKEEVRRLMTREPR